MKKALIGLAVVVCVSAAHAQQLKFMLGPVFSTYTGRWPSFVFPGPLGQPTGLNPFRNVQVASTEGIGLEFNVHKLLRLEADVLYGDLGSRFSSTGMVLLPEREAYAMSGFGIPVVLKLRPRLKNPVPYLIAGVELLAVVSHTRTSLVLPEGSFIYQEILRDDLGKATRSLDIGPLVGLGIEIPVLGQAFLLEARYRAGLGNLVKGYPRDVYNAKLRTLTLLIGYQMK